MKLHLQKQCLRNSSEILQKVQSGESIIFIFYYDLLVFKLFDFKINLYFAFTICCKFQRLCFWAIIWELENFNYKEIGPNYLLI